MQVIHSGTGRGRIFRREKNDKKTNITLKKDKIRNGIKWVIFIGLLNLITSSVIILKLFGLWDKYVY